MVGFNKPFMYDAEQHSQSAFDPKAVTRASWQAKPPRPKPQDGPLLGFGHHPDAHMVPAFRATNFIPMAPSTKSWIKGMRVVQLVLRALEGLGAAGLLVLMIIITNVDDLTAWVMRIVAAVAIVLTVYSVYHLARPAGHRNPGSTAAYHVLAAITDLAVLPLYAFGALAARNNSSGWATLLSDQGLVKRALVPALTYVLVAGAGLHLVSLAVSLWLGLMYRRIAAMPPDMNPLEDRFTARPLSSKQQRRSAVVSRDSQATAFSHDAARDHPESAKEANDRKRKSNHYNPYAALALEEDEDENDLARPRSIPFMAIRPTSGQSSAALSTASTARNSHADLPARHYQIDPGSSPRGSAVPVTALHPRPPAPAAGYGQRQPSYVAIPIDTAGDGGNDLQDEHDAHDKPYDHPNNDAYSGDEYSFGDPADSHSDSSEEEEEEEEDLGVRSLGPRRSRRYSAAGAGAGAHYEFDGHPGQISGVDARTSTGTVASHRVAVVSDPPQQHRMPSQSAQPGAGDRGGGVGGGSDYGSGGDRAPRFTEAWYASESLVSRTQQRLRQQEQEEHQQQQATTAQRSDTKKTVRDRAAAYEALTHQKKMKKQLQQQQQQQQQSHHDEPVDLSDGDMAHGHEADDGGGGGDSDGESGYYARIREMMELARRGGAAARAGTNGRSRNSTASTTPSRKGSMHPDPLRSHRPDTWASPAAKKKIGTTPTTTTTTTTPMSTPGGNTTTITATPRSKSPHPALFTRKGAAAAAAALAEVHLNDRRVSGGGGASPASLRGSPLYKRDEDLNPDMMDSTRGAGSPGDANNHMSAPAANKRNSLGRRAGQLLARKVTGMRRGGRNRDSSIQDESAFSVGKSYGQLRAGTPPVKVDADLNGSAFYDGLEGSGGDLSAEAPRAGIRQVSGNDAFASYYDPAAMGVEVGPAGGRRRMVSGKYAGDE